MMIEARRAYRGVSGALLALALVLLATVPVAQADTIYPDNKITGTSFDEGLDGWTEFSNQCSLVTLGGTPFLDLGAPQPLCSPHTGHAAGTGTPPGSLEQFSDQAVSASVLGSAIGVIEGRSTALSPVFTVPVGGAATFTVDRRFQLDALLPLGVLTDPPARFAYSFTLVDEAGGPPLILDGDTVDITRNTNSPFSGHGPIALPAGSVQSGHSYRIQVTTIFRANPENLLSAVAALYTARAQYDNVRLRVDDGTALFRRPTVQTLPATDITETGPPPGIHSATLNGEVNAQGLPTTFIYRYGTDPALFASGTAIIPVPPAAPFDGGQLTTAVSRPRTVGGLLACTRYYFRVEATNQLPPAAAITAVGETLSFTTDCAPTATTLDAIAGTTTATLQSALTPNGADTKYYYEYGLDSLPAGTFSARIPIPNSELSVGEGYNIVAANPQVINGLTQLETYRFRVVAFNAVGTTAGAIKTFKTVGPGNNGTNGTDGTNGADGTNGTNGTNGLDGATGAAGPPGAPGAKGPPGPKGSPGPAPTICGTAKVSCKNPMIRIDATTIRVPMKGRLKGVVRVRVFCKALAVETCSGQMKIRSRSKIQPQGFGFPARPVRKVTFATAPLQLDERKIGFAIFSFNTQRLSVLQRLRSVAGEVTVTVIDADNNRQRVKKNVTVRAG